MITPVAPIPFMGRDQSRRRLEYHQEKTKREKEKKRIEKQTIDYWEGRKNHGKKN
jgi:hypothetical protein